MIDKSWSKIKTIRVELYATEKRKILLRLRNIKIKGRFLLELFER
jgi:hypothetical protein